MKRSALCLSLVFVLCACGSEVAPPDALDGNSEPDGGVDFAGSAARMMAGGGAVGADAAVVKNEAPAAGGEAVQPEAGSGGDGGAVAAGAGGSTNGVAGTSSTVGVAGSGGSTAGTTGAAGAVAGAPAVPCPDADADGVCNADDKCPAGSDVDADANGYADACEKKLWEVKQSLSQSFSYPSNQVNASSIPLRLAACGGTYIGLGLGNDDYDGLTQGGVSVDKRLTRTQPAELADDVIHAWADCGEFTPSVNLPMQVAAVGTKSVQSPKHIAYVRLTGTGKLVDHRPSSSSYYYTVTLDVTWTAYGY